jgi:hypothetical protein
MANAAAPMRVIMAVMLLLAVVILSMANEGAAQATRVTMSTGKEEELSFANACAADRACVGSSSEVPAAGACICSRNCACAGECILKSSTEDAQACFINCVLKNGCVCPKAGDYK